MTSGRRCGRNPLFTLVALIATALAGCGPRIGPVQVEDSPYLVIFAGDEDAADSDFLAVIDVRPGSAGFGKVVASTPIGMTASMPHHMEYVMPPAGELLFMNAHHHEKSLLVDLADPRAPRIARTFAPPPPLRFPHDYSRTPTGTRLVGFLRSEGAGPDPAEKASPGNHGGIAEYSANGDLIRTAFAAIAGSRPVRPYAFALLPDIDRLVVTSAPMMEDSWADVVQIYRYSDFKLLKTLDLPPGRVADGREIEGSNRAGFGPRILPDGSIFLNAYGCAFFHLTDIGSDAPQLANVFTLETPPPPNPDSIRGSCGIPVRFGKYWLMPAGQLHAVVVLDISDPDAPREVSRLSTRKTFSPHWLARDPASNRLVLGAELGGEEGFYLLRFDESSGQLAFDSEADGYVSLKNQDWPHGQTGPAWGHAALFLGQRQPDTSSVDVDSCKAGGGSIQRVCRRQFPACVTSYKDAGQRCTDSDQCEGRCILDIDHEPAPDETVSGRCEQDDDPCGCKIEVIDSRVGGGACVD